MHYPGAVRSSPTRVPSRLMPRPSRSEPDPLGQVLVTLVPLALLTALTLVCWPLVLLVLLMFVDSWLHAEPAPTNRTPRTDATICHFARAFERRAVDTWILRATYEQLSESHGEPIRADDRLFDLLDAEEIDFEAAELADRCGRSLDHAEANPFYGSISTVRDLVQFLNHQPLLPTTRTLRGLPA